MGFSRACNELEVATVRFNFPYMEAGRRSPDTPTTAIAAWRAVVEAAEARGAPVWAGGKSYGGRMASMAVADGMDVAGLVFLGYPLHAPAKPDQVRADHLSSIRVPMLFLQGSKDPFARPDRLEPILAALGSRATHVQILGGDHSFNLSRKDDSREVGGSLAPLVEKFIREHP